MTWYVYSTATCPGTYVEYEDTDLTRGHNVSIPKKFKDGRPMKVMIKGGHGLAHGEPGKHLYTPKGVVTQVTDEEMEMLQRNPAFKRHQDRGFITYDKKNVDPIKKAANMAEKDGCAPITPKDYTKSENSKGDTPIYKPKTAAILGG